MNALKSKLQLSSPELRFFWIISLVFIALYASLIIGNRLMMNDFKVLYLAAEALTDCEKVYFKAFGLDTGYYKYSPFYLLVLAPFSFFPYVAVASLYFMISTFAAGLISTLR